MTNFTATKPIARVWKARWIIIAVFIVTGIGAYIYSLSLPNYYKSTVNCVPAAVEQGMMGAAAGGLSSALKDFGLNKLTQGGGTSYEFIVVLFSRQIRDSMIKKFNLVDEYKMQGEPMQAVRDMFDDNLEVNLRAEGNYEISIWSLDPRKSVAMCEAFVEYANQVANGIYRKDALKTTTYMTERVIMIDSVLNSLTAALQKYSKDYLMFNPEAQATASAAALTEVRTNLLQQQTVLGLLQRSYGEADPQSRAQAKVVEQLEQQYQDFTNKPGYVGDFSIREAAGVGAGYMRLIAEFEAHAKLKAFILPTLEQARLDQQKNTPSLIIVDDAVPMEKKDRPKRSLIAAGSALGSSILVVVCIMLWAAWKDFSHKVASA